MSRTFRQIPQAAFQWCPFDYRFLISIGLGHIQWRKDYRLWKRMDRRNDRHSEQTRLRHMIKSL